VKRGWVILGGVAVIAAGVLVAPGQLRRLEFFRVKRVEVIGARYVSGDQVAATLGLPATASLVDDTDPLARKLVRMRGVREARVSRRWPGTLVVRLTEADPVGLARTDAGLVLIDDRGRVLPFDPTRAPADLPLAPADPVVAGLMARLREWEPGLFSEVEAAERAGGDVALRTGDRRLLLRGDATPETLRALVAVMGDLGRKGKRYQELDARYTDRVYVRGMRS
jgi:cell division protein FtsQ